MVAEKHEGCPLMEEGRECAGLAQVREQIRQLVEVPALLRDILAKIASIETRLNASDGADARLRSVETQFAISSQDRQQLHQDLNQFKEGVTRVVWTFATAAIISFVASIWGLVVSHAPAAATHAATVVK